MESQIIQEIIKKHKGTHGELISILEDTQDAYGYLPSDILTRISEQTGHSLTDIYGIATFYKLFKLSPRGKHLVSVCLGTACHVRGGEKVKEEFERRLGMCAGQTSTDGEFTLETVNCLGACALGPIVLADGTYFSNVTPSSVKNIIKKIRTGADKTEAHPDQAYFPVIVKCRKCGKNLLDNNHMIREYPSISFSLADGQKKKKVWVSSLYGYPVIESGSDIPDEAILELTCPFCNTGTLHHDLCEHCAAPVAVVDIDGGGRFGICSRKKCGNQTLYAGIKDYINSRHIKKYSDRRCEIWKN